MYLTRIHHCYLCRGQYSYRSTPLTTSVLWPTHTPKWQVQIAKTQNATREMLLPIMKMAMKVATMAPTLMTVVPMTANTATVTTATVTTMEVAWAWRGRLSPLRKVYTNSKHLKSWYHQRLPKDQHAILWLSQIVMYVSLNFFLKDQLYFGHFVVRLMMWPRVTSCRHWLPCHWVSINVCIPTPIALYLLHWPKASEHAPTWSPSPNALELRRLQ